jgi:hypothetical protein
MENDIFKTVVKLLIRSGGLIQANAFAHLVSTNVENDMALNTQYTTKL